MTTVVGLFDTFPQAQHAAQVLVNAGIGHDAISIVANDARGEHARAVSENTRVSEGATTGAVSGGVFGGVLGLFVGLGALAIPGIGPVLAAGPLAAALGSAGAGALVGAGTGIIGGGLLGTLVAAGVPETHAHAYAEGVRRGGTLVTVQTDNVTAGQVHDALLQNGAVDVDARSEEWRRGGWNGFDSNARPYTGEHGERDSDAAPANTETDPAANSPAASVGALSGGMVPGAYGAAGSAIFGPDDTPRPDWERD